MNKKILASIFVIGILAFAMGWGTYSWFSDTEKSTGNVFTAGIIDISIDPTGGQDVVTIDGDVYLKPSQTGYTKTVITNVGNDPCEVWKHIANVVNDENGITEPEGEYYSGHAGSNTWLISDWIHYDLIACKPIVEKYYTYGKPVEAIIVKEWCCCTTTWTVDIISENVPHGVYGIGLVISTDGNNPDFQVWYAEHGPKHDDKDIGWYYQAYPWDTELIAVENVPWIQVNERDPSSKHFEISIDCAHLGGPGATYWWNMQLRTNLISWVGGAWDWTTTPVKDHGFLENHVGIYEVEIPEAHGWFLTYKGPNVHPANLGYGVECKWIYLGVLQPGERMCVIQSYHLDKDVDNWGQSDKVFFNVEFLAQQIEGTPLPPEPTPVLPGHGRP